MRTCLMIGLGAVMCSGSVLADEAPRKEVFYMELPADGLAITHHGQHLLASGPAGIGHLTGARDPEQPAADRQGSERARRDRWYGERGRVVPEPRRT